MFTWLPLYKEVTTWILQYRNRQPELCNILREIGFEKNLTDEDENGKIPLEVMDPISFFGYFQKPKNPDNRRRYWSELIAREGFTSAIPADFDGLPSAQPMNLWMFRYKKDRKPGDIDRLWDLAEQAVKGKLKAETFETIYAMHGIGLAKLTQGLFWLNPEAFYPIDAHKWYLELDDDTLEVETLDDYERLLKTIKDKFKKPLYELSYDAWRHTQEAEEEESEEEVVRETDRSTFTGRLGQYDPDKLSYFFDLVRRILEEFKISRDDRRIALTDRPRRLSFIVGQRYCLNLIHVKGKSTFRFISLEKLFPDSESFGGKQVAYFNRAEEIDVVRQYEGVIKAAVEIELNRSRKSPHLDVDLPEFREIIFGKQSLPSTVSLGASFFTPLNRILYGPPGTGKTYLSKRLALSILEEKSIDEITQQYPSSSAITEQFKKYQESGQVIFTTFHQSFSYEDFIEGIKPIVTGESQEDAPDAEIESAGRIGYKVVPGVFKQIADQARSYKSSVSEGDASSYILSKSIDLQEKTFFKMSLGNTQQNEGKDIYNYCISNNCIALGWGGRNDFTKADTEEKVLSKFEDVGGARSRYEVTAMKCFRLWMKKGDIVLISDGNLLVRAIAQIEGDYYFDSKSLIGPKHFRKVTWLLKDVRIPVNELYQKQFSQQTVYMLWDNEIKRDFFITSRTKALKNPNHVIIIDEINRGNVSGIFGELITLIEEDKREGRKEAIEVKLPYSKEVFSVPDNLYIIGTMNTADRSVEALDAALRRRFSFEEMPPRYDLEELSRQVAGIALKDILLTINSRLEKLLDKDHKIGHSYFMFQNGVDPKTGFIESFYKNIIPLLQEYFFGDIAKIGLVLGKGFVEKIEDADNLFCEFEYDGVELLQSKPIFSIIDYRDPQSVLRSAYTFDEALRQLMKI